MRAAWECLIPFWPQNFHRHILVVVYPVLEFLHAAIMFIAKVVRECAIKICIVFTFGTIHVMYLLLNDFNFMRPKDVSGKNPYSILVFASYCQ